MRSVAPQFLEAYRYGQCRLYTRRPVRRSEMVDRCVRVLDFLLHFANYHMIEQERQLFADSWRDKSKNKKKKASKDRHYAFTVSNIFVVLRKMSHYLQISSAGPSGSKKAEKNPNKALQEFVRRQNDAASDVSLLLGCVSVFLTQLKGTSGDSDEVPLSRTLASKSKGKARPAQRRNIIPPRDDSDTHDDDLPHTNAMPSKGKRSISAPGTSAATSARPSKPIRGNKRQRLSYPEGDKDTVSRQSHLLLGATNLSCIVPNPLSP